MKRFKLSFLQFPVFIFFLISAIYSKVSINEKEYMTRKLDPKELLGTWYLSNETLDMLSEEGVDFRFLANYDINTLKIEENNSFICKMPFIIFSYKDEDQYAHYTLKGKWEVQTQIKNKEIKNILELTNIEGAPRIGHLSFYITEIEGKLVIWRYLKANPKKVYVFERN